MVVRALFAQCVTALKTANIPTATLDARLIIQHVMEKDELYIVMHPQDEVAEESEQKICALIDKRKNHVPLAYLIHMREFMGLPFYVDEHVLIPRPDSELLVETVLDALERGTSGKTYEVADIGTGSGALAVSVAYYAKNAQVCSLDVSEDALIVAKRNACQNGVDEKTDFYCCNILKENPPKTYDIILSNPPYIRPDVIQTLEDDVKDYEPMLALDGGADGLVFYRHIAMMAPRWLKRPGMLAFEIGYDQEKDVTELLQKNGFLEVKCFKDLAYNPRVVVGKLV